MDDVGSGGAKFLSQFSDVTSLLGVFPPTDPVVGNQNQPWLFNGNLLVNIKGTSVAALVLTDAGGWSAPPMLGSQRFRRLRVDVYVDVQRDALGGIMSSDQGTINRGNQVFNAVHRRLHRRDPDTIVWGDMVTFACQLLNEPIFNLLPDGDRAMLGTASYGVSLSGWTDAVSLFIGDHVEHMFVSLSAVGCQLCGSADRPCRGTSVREGVPRMSNGRPLKVILKSPFSRFSGYGNDGFGILRALHEWGCDVYPQPVWVDVPIPHDLLPLFGKSLKGPFDLLINHWDPDHLEITREARQVSRVAVAWTMWEFASAPAAIKKPCKKHLPCAQCGILPASHADAEDELHPYTGKLRSERAIGDPDCPDCKHVDSGLYPHARGIHAHKSEGRQGLRERLRWYDLVLGYDEVSLAALAPFISPKVHSGVLQGGYESRLLKPIDRDWHGERFQFLQHGQLNHRKQPWLTIEAWHKLKAEKGEAFAPARLAMHTSMPGVLFPELNTPFAHVGIKVFCASLDEQAKKEMYAASHCLLAPSRGEGKNLPALEFLTTAGAVAATNFGGHKQWLGEDWAYPLDYQLGATFGDAPWERMTPRSALTIWLTRSGTSTPTGKRPGRRRCWALRSSRRCVTGRSLSRTCSGESAIR